MTILAVESSTETASVAILKDKHVLAINTQTAGRLHSQTLVPMIKALMENSFVEFSHLDCMAVANGPGSFTGLRIGVAAVLGLARAVGMPYYGVSSLEGCAYSLIADGHVKHPICVIQNARNRQYYNAIFEPCDGDSLRRITEDRVIDEESLLDEIRDKRYYLAGDYPDSWYNGIGSRIRLKSWYSATGVALCAYDGHTRNASSIEYLRLPQAERERLKKNSAH